MADTVVFDLDGTLVDTNYQHALAWHRAFRRFEVTVPLWRVHRAIGMGGDTLVPAVAGREIEQRHGERLRAAWVEEFDDLLDDVEPFDGAHDLLVDVAQRGFTIVLASSGKAAHVDRFLDLIDAKPLAAAWTTSEDAESSKPEPDLVSAALGRVEAGSGVMVGDSTWDVIAAGKIGVPTIAVRTGGFSASELYDAGAVAVFASLIEFRAAIEGTALARPTRRD